MFFLLLKNGGGKRTSHHLIFATKDPLGYGIMKEIMAKYSSEEHQGVPSFEYCPASAIHPLLFELSRPLTDLEGMLLGGFAGRTLTMKEVFDLHNVGRPVHKEELQGDPFDDGSERNY